MHDEQQSRYDVLCFALRVRCGRKNANLGRLRDRALSPTPDPRYFRSPIVWTAIVYRLIRVLERLGVRISRVTFRLPEGGGEGLRGLNDLRG